jgi:hypothetical protein
LSIDKNLCYDGECPNYNNCHADARDCACTDYCSFDARCCKPAASTRCGANWKPIGFYDSGVGETADCSTGEGWNWALEDSAGAWCCGSDTAPVAVTTVVPAGWQRITTSFEFPETLAVHVNGVRASEIAIAHGTACTPRCKTLEVSRTASS